MRNSELIEAINELAEEIGEKVETKGLKHDELVMALDDLKELAIEKAKAAEADGSYVVAEGKSVTSVKGILESGDSVCADYFVTGKKAFDVLVEKGVVVKG